MFGFSRRRMRLGRIKVQLSNSDQGTRSPLRHPKRVSNTNGDGNVAASSVSDDPDCQCSSAAPDINSCTSGSSESWMVLSIAGDKPTPRFNHSATVVGNKMVVVGGECGNELLDDVQVLKFDRFSWTTVSSKIYLSPTSLPLKIPACKGHSMVSWGKKALLIGGKTDPGSEKVSVWAFDTETECWSLMEAKGDIPVARSGHTVVRANAALILFGGEDAKRRKLNDLHMFDLKSMTWLPLHCTGTAPSPRSSHVAALYDDRILFIFGGSAKSKTLNDLHSLDFETMIWSRIKIRGFHPSPRAGCCGVLCGSKWYITGGGSRKKRHVETLIFDVLKVEWSVAVTSPPYSITTNKGFSLVLVQHKEKDFLVAFGGSKKEPSNQVEVLILEKNEHSSSRTLPSKGPGLLSQNRFSSTDMATQLNSAPASQVESVGRQNLASVLDERGSSRRSMSESFLANTNPSSGSVSLRKQFNNEEEPVPKLDNNLEDDSSCRKSTEHRKQIETGSFCNTSGRIKAHELHSSELETLGGHNSVVDKLPLDNEERVLPETEGGKSAVLSASSSVYQMYETKMATLIKKNGMLEGQLAAALVGREAAEKNLSFVLKSRQEMEKKLADTINEMELLKEKLSALELAQEETNNLSNIVHSDNVRLEHDVAFLKAVLDDTQKELHSTRGVVSNERARAFQLQVEVFHLKQRLQSLENRASTPRKPFQV
ncbi:hypothetical protein Nepgr_031140 [Nepenthes gracilis]|uniref:Uncharacterized protein n=1 Tax=Nepenthes gracilis TaxID=150966 RepID=A0AAD3TI98_NEPGR|nr:hypothetical protein Nepgr_031140 [Nepenthes gracilis]